MANRTGRLLGVMTAATLLCAMVPIRGQDEQWLQYRSSQNAASIMPVLGTHDVRATAQRPVDVATPEFEDHLPLFAQWTTPLIKAGFLWPALDRSTATEKPVTFSGVCESKE
jgi:hypothetical protein